MLTKYDSKGNVQHLLQPDFMEFNNKYIKFENGLVIMFGTANAPANQSTGRFVFPVKLKEYYKSLATHSWSSESKGTVTLGAATLEYIDVAIYDESGISKSRNASVLVFGRWK